LELLDDGAIDVIELVVSSAFGPGAEDLHR
jgi:hypothetical protein